MEQNRELEQAWQFISATNTSIFLTGKAGTGKTTFLRQLREHTPKRMVVVAPTGVAAINAGGVTIHSFFQLSFSPFIPDATQVSAREVYRFGKDKKKIIRSLDLLVIDEISMVRSDLLDAIDGVLRKYKDAHKPFGGVQLLMIGDLQQLPPVVKDNEQQLLSRYYATPYFFGSHALQQVPYVTIELRKVYRQSDQTFVALLNRIRENRIDQQVLDLLNARHIPNFRPNKEEGYIRLTTHNATAKQYNESELNRLDGTPHSFVAQIKGEFPQHAFPAELSLTLKEGAQVMFIKNDPSGAQRFYNGRIGHVVSLTAHQVVVRCVGESSNVVVEPMEWENSKYTLDEATNEIREEVEGVFKQLPLRLAWAITIHKSQGLTFERAVIDSTAAFAHGQVYVALSRCKTLDGTVLASPISASAVIIDDTVTHYVDERLAGASQNEFQLDVLKRQYYVEQLCDLFNFAPLAQRLQQLNRFLDEYFFKTYPQLLTEYKLTLSLFNSKVVKVATQFATLCQQVSYTELLDEPLQLRITKGAAYFKQQLDELFEELLPKTQVESDNKELQKRFGEALLQLAESTYVKGEVCKAIAEEGFSVLNYLKVKHRATLKFLEVDKPTRKSRATKSKVEIPSDILQPELYNQLREWRRKRSEEVGRPAYSILHQVALMAITNYMPQSLDQLIAMPHFGKVSADKYGDEILALINDYVKQSGVVRPLFVIEEKAPKSKKEKAPKVDTKQVTLELYQSGKSSVEIAQDRGLSEATIFSHLAYYVSIGEIPVTRFMPQKKVDEILARINPVDPENCSLSQLKERCGDDYTYHDIRIVLAYLQNNQK